jgi:hypothetical protein
MDGAKEHKGRLTERYIAWSWQWSELYTTQDLSILSEAPSPLAIK